MYRVKWLKNSPAINKNRQSQRSDIGISCSWDFSFYYHQSLSVIRLISHPTNHKVPGYLLFQS